MMYGTTREAASPGPLRVCRGGVPRMLRAVVFPLFAVLLLAELSLISCSSQGSRAKSSGLFPISHGGKGGYIDRKGTIVIGPRFDGVASFSEGLARVWIADGSQTGSLLPRGRCAFIDPTGKVVLETAAGLLDVGDFHEGKAPIVVGGVGGFINTRGEYVFGPMRGCVRSLLNVTRTPYSYSYDPAFSQGLAPVIVGEKMGYIGGDGRIRITPRFDLARNFSEGLAPVRMNRVFGYVDRAGRMAINPQFIEAEDFSEGLARVLAGGDLDSTGNLVGDAKWGFIDKTGKYVIMPQFDFAGDFHEGLAMVGLGGSDPNGRLSGLFEFTYGYIDRKGRWLINPARVGSNLDI